MSEEVPKSDQEVRVKELFHYKIFPERNLVVAKLLKPVTAKDIACWESVMMQEPLFSSDMDGVMDQREAAAELSDEDVRDLANLNKSQHKVSGTWVHLVDTPVPTARAIQYKREVTGLQRIEVFNTVEAASNCLGYDLSEYLVLLAEETPASS